jgi:hypothetical protein
MLKMKKTLLSISGIAAAILGFAQQTPSPSWTITQNSNFPIPSAGIRYMDAVDPNSVWATGYDGTAGNTNRAYCWVTRTNNGGATWTTSPVWPSTVTPVIGDTSTYVISSIEGINSSTAWVAAYKKINGGSQGGVFKTTDGGSTWLNMTSASMFTNAASFCNWVAFFTPSVGVCDGDPNSSTGNEHELWRTTDGGNTWSAVAGANIPNPVSGEYALTNVYEKFGSTNLWFGTNKGRIYRSSDAGVTWNVTTLNASNSIGDIAFYDANNGLAVTYAASPSTVSTVYSTTDGGATWNLLPNSANDPNYGRNDICAIPGTCWFASCGAGNGNTILSFSMDNGATWNSWGSTGIQYLAIDFVNPSTGWAGSFSDPSNAALNGFYKYNGGSLLQPPSANFSLAAAACVSTAIQLGNSSTGNPCPTFTWTTFPPTAVFSSSTAATPTVSFNTPGTFTVILTASNSVTTSVVTRTVSVSTCAGFTTNNLKGVEFIVFPNPGKDMFNVALPYATTPYNITVTNVLGSVVYSDKAIVTSGNYSVNLSDNKTGVYFITIENNGSKTTKKIILE